MMLMEMVATGFEAVIVTSRWLGEAVRADLEQHGQIDDRPEPVTW